MGLFDFLKSDVDFPEFETDQFFEASQEKLFGLSKGLTEGRLPSAFQDIITSGGPEFQRLLKSIQDSIQKSVLQNQASRNIRGGLGTGVIADKIGDITAELGFKDFSRAVLGQERILGKGIAGLSGVRGAGLANQAQRNQFNMAESEFDLNKEQADTGNIMDFFGEIGDIAGSVTGIGSINKLLSGGLGKAKKSNIP